MVQISLRGVKERFRNSKKYPSKTSKWNNRQKITKLRNDVTIKLERRRYFY